MPYSIDLEPRRYRVALARLAVFLAAVLFPMVASATELRNGDLEVVSGSAIDGWTPYRWEGEGTIEPTSGTRSAGERSVVLTGFGVAKQALFQRLQLPACSWRLTGSAAAFGASPNPYGLAGAIHLAIAGDRNITHQVATGDSDWRRFELTFTTIRTTETILYLFHYGSGRVFFDDLRLERVANCALTGDTFSVAKTVEKPLAFVPPLDDEDLVLSGYCTDPGYAARPLCRRLAASSDAVSRLTVATPARPPRVIGDFEQNAPFPASVPRAPRPISGSSSGLIYPGQYIAASRATGLRQDWTDYDWLRFEASNPTSEVQPLAIEIWDDKTTGYWSRVNWYTSLPPGRSTVEIPLQAFVGEKNAVVETRRLELHTIRHLAFSQTKAEIAVDDVRLEQEPPVESLFPELVALDAGSNASPVMNGFRRMTGGSIYRAERGWGFIPGTRFARTEDRRHPDSLNRDWISVIGGGLQFDLPDGDYVVWLMLEDAGYWTYYPSWTQRSVIIQEREVEVDRRLANDFLDRYFRHSDDEDWPGDRIWARYVKDRYAPKRYEATVKGGRLTIRFTSNGHPFAATIAGVVIYPKGRKDAGDRFMADLERRLERQFDAEYRQMVSPPSPAPTAPANALGGKAWVFQRPATEASPPGFKPAGSDLRTSLRSALAKGHVQELTVGLYVDQDVDLIEAKLDVPGVRIAPKKVRYRATRRTDSGTVYESLPRLLDPLAVSGASPLRLRAGTNRRLWFDMTVSPDAKPGTVSGSLALRLATGETTTLPVTVEIYPWTLPAADIPVGFLGVAPAYPSTTYPEVLERRIAGMRASIDLLAESGMTAVSGGLGSLEVSRYFNGAPQIDFANANIAMQAIRRRFRGEVLTYDGFDIGGALTTSRVTDTMGALGRDYQTAIREITLAIELHGRGQGWLPLRFVVGDEPQGSAIGDSIAAAEALAQARPRARSAVFTSFTTPKDPEAALAGKVDRIYLNHHSEAAIRHIVASGSECALYNRNSRFERGFYLLKMREVGCGGLMRYAYSIPSADPWYGLDGREEDYLAAFVHRDGSLRPSLDLLTFRIGLVDYRTVMALGQAIDAAEPGPARTSARVWHTDLLQRTAIGHDARQPWTESDLDALRQEAARHLQALGFTGSAANDAAGAPKR